MIGLSARQPASTDRLRCCSAVEESAHEAGYATIIATSSSLDTDSLTHAIGRPKGSSVEGIIIVSPLVSSGEALRQVKCSVPTLAIWASSDTGLAVTGMNHRAAAAAATRHLLELGHPTMHHVSGPLDWIGSEQRMLGWRTTLEEAGVEPPCVIEGDWTSHAGYVQSGLLLSDPDVTAVLTANDQMAHGLYRGAFEKGRRIPDDLSVVGYDDSLDLQHYTPPLTMVHPDFHLLGARAFASVHAMMTESA